MTRALRVLVVDDSSVARAVIRRAVDSIDGFTVCDVAVDGLSALHKIRIERPDVVTLDVDMPGMSGLEALTLIHKEHPCLPVIMCSQLTSRGAEATVDALLEGATDWITKPHGAASRDQAITQLTQALTEKLRLVARKLARPAETPAVNASTDLSERGAESAVTFAPGDPRPLRNQRTSVVAIGASTGGPAALATLMTSLPSSFIAPILIAQHMPPLFTASLAKRLSDISHYEVTEACPGAIIEPGKAYVAPGAQHMVVRRAGATRIVDTNDEPPENSCRPAVDVLLRSIAEEYGGNVVVAILTGMGKDGFAGCQQLRPLGGSIIAQNKASSVVWGMPGFVTQGGLADAVLPLTQIGPDIVRRFAAIGKL